MDATVDADQLTRTVWDVAVVGAGPAGSNAALHAARAGATVVILERQQLPRYKRCGGGLIGTALAELPQGFDLPARERIDRVTFSYDLTRPRTRRATTPLLTMVDRATFDAALARFAVAAGAALRTEVTVTGVVEETNAVVLETSAGPVRARAVVGADGSTSRIAHAVGATFDQVDLGLEVELPVDERRAAWWAGHVWLDFAKLAGAYAWVFPKGTWLTVGAIATKGHSGAERAYLDRFMRRLALTGLHAEHEGGHLTRVRADGSPLTRGRLLLAGDAAGLIEPWTREGITSALRSGRLAGTAAAAMAKATTPERMADAASRYSSQLLRDLTPTLDAGRRLLDLSARHPWLPSRAATTAPGWRAFSDFSRGRHGLDYYLDRPLVRPVLRWLAPPRPT